MAGGVESACGHNHLRACAGVMHVYEMWEYGCKSLGISCQGGYKAMLKHFQAAQLAGDTTCLAAPNTLSD